MPVTIEEILARDDLHREIVKVPEWNNAEILVVSMTAAERSEVERRWTKKEASSDPAAFRVDVLSRSVKKSDGMPFGTEEQFKALMGKNAAAVERLFDASCRVSGYSKKDVQDIEKN